MIKIKRTDSADKHFQELVKELDRDLAIRDGDETLFYAQSNKIAALKHVVVAFEEEAAVGCAAIKEYSVDTIEVKRMYVPETKRGRGIATIILSELEKWAKELSFAKCILETGKKQPEAIALYKKNGYKLIPNYGQYENVSNSVCLEKKIS